MHIVQVLAINKYYLSPQIRQLALKLGTFPFILSPLRRYLFIVFNSLNISQIQEKLRFENVSFCFTRNVNMNWKLTVCIRPVCQANSDRLNPGPVFSKFSSQPGLKVPSVQGFHSDKYPESQGSCSDLGRCTLDGIPQRVVDSKGPENPFGYGLTNFVDCFLNFVEI